MGQPAGSIKAELNEAVAHGIRQRGPDAVGLLLVGFARLIVGTAALAILIGASALFGYDVSGVHFAGLTGVSALITWLAVGRSRS